MPLTREKSNIIRIHRLKCSICTAAPKYEYRIGKHAEYACLQHSKEVQGMLELQSTLKSEY